MGEVILGLGARPSEKADKTFSSPSLEGAPPEVELGEDTPAPTAARAEPPGAPTRTSAAVGLTTGDIEALRAHSCDGGDSPLRAKVAALVMELAALKRGSEVSTPEKELAAALENQTKVLQAALGTKSNHSTLTTVKADVQWPTLSDDRSDVKDVTNFYEEFEDICALADNCRGLGPHERLLALRARCRGSRLKTCTNIY